MLADNISNNSILENLVPEEKIRKIRSFNSQVNMLHSKISTSKLSSKKDSLLNILTKTQSDKEYFLKEIEKNYPEYYQLKYNNINSLSLKQIRSTLKSNQLLVDFFVGESKVHIFAITKNGSSYFSENIEDDFYDNIRRFRKSIEDGLEINADLNQKLLDVTLSKCIKEYGTKVDHFILIPDKALNIVPFEALKSEGKYLLQNWAFSNLYSHFQMRSFIKDSGAKYIGYGTKYNSQLNEALKRSYPLEKFNLSQLPFAVKEIQSSNALWDREGLINRESKKDHFIKNAKNYDIVHLALHGIINDKDPDQSAIVFDNSENDFLLKNYELYTLDLDIELAILSACNTADGQILKGDGVRSIARAFAFAGCPSIVSSLWSTYEEPTNEIITSFNKYLQEGMSKAKALQKAKLDYLNNAYPGMEKPKFWANMILIGNTESSFLNMANSLLSNNFHSFLNSLSQKTFQSNNLIL